MRAAAILAAAVLAAGCVTYSFPPRTPAETARLGPKGKIEAQIDAKGRIVDLEFHVPPTELPAAVVEAADRVIGEGPVLDAEREFVDGVAYWEVVKRVGGKEVEVLFDAAGRPRSWEIEIDPGEAPPNVLAAAEAAAPGARRKVEKILGAARELVAYHVKTAGEQGRYKVEVSPRGEVVAVWREVDAEIEVPVPAR